MMPSWKYRRYPRLPLPDRTWPDRDQLEAPRWCSVDLRDGNQALVDPMDPRRKLAMFTMLRRIGFTEIEVGFPAASQTDFDFVRKLVDDNLLDDNVTIQVLTQARPEIIARTFEALVGVPKAVVHLYNSTSTLQRRVVFGHQPADTVALAVDGARQVLDGAARLHGTHVTFEYSPESFTGTEPDVALDVCSAVLDVWQPESGRPVIVNLPATVELDGPHVYADQVEWMHRNLPYRDHIVLSVHPHNDRGCAVAAAELALLAGAQRVEGCLFGNGERTGNVCTVTLALNLLTHGIDPGLDLSDLDGIRRVVEDCNRLTVHERHPYVGDLVHTAFSGSHQDAIAKGLAAAAGDRWDVPYLPIDPADIGKSYAALIRVNSQSGKGGVAYLLAAHAGLQLPRRLQIEVTQQVQRHVDAHGGEVEGDELFTMFEAEYLDDTALRMADVHVAAHGGQTRVNVTLTGTDGPVMLEGSGNGPVDALCTAFTATGVDLRVLDYHEHALDAGSRARAVAYVEAVVDGTVLWGVGTAPSTVDAALAAVVGAVRRATCKQ